MPAFTPTKLDHNSSADRFKQIILPIIASVKFIEAFREKHGEAKFRQAMSDYYNEQKRKSSPGEKEPRGTGGKNKAYELRGKVDVDNLIKSYNDIIHPVQAVMYRQVAQGLLMKLGHVDKAHEERKTYIKYINTFSFCQHLFKHKFPGIQAFEWSFTEEEVPSSPSIEAFVASSTTLTSVKIVLKGEILVPAKLAKTDALQTDHDTPAEQIENEPLKQDISLPLGVATQALQLPTQNGDSDEYSDRCVGHHLNYDRELVLADTALTWRGQKLIRVVMKQRNSFRKRANKYTFVAEADHIIDGGKSIYVVLQAQTAADLQMQITIERTADEAGQRNGVFSYLKHKKIQIAPIPAVPISGLVVLQTVPDDLNIEEFEQQLDAISQSIADDAKDADQIRLRNAIRIRYRLLDQVIVIPKLLTKSEATPWVTLQTYVGRYVCYYMRLSKNPAKFEISQIQVFPDGRATLRQPPNEQVFEGYVRVNGDRLWIFFRPNTYEEPTGKETIRFIVDKGMSDGQLVFRGMFSSQTMTEKRLVSGRMLMRQLPPNEEWPSIEPVECQNVNFTHIPREDDRKFFMEEWKPETNLTDGPIWAEVSRRLQGRSALEKLNKLCTDPHPNEIPFNNNKFYYYTFKADPANKAQFVIERNLVEFQPNGKVKIYLSPGKYYEGYAYYDKNTLRLALSYAKSGFLELFLELDDDDSTLSEIKILYGMSLWHSSKRLQGKMVVLSRYGDTPDKEEAEQFKFTNEAELEKLESENLRGGGVINYVQGELNRYMHATTDSSHQQFRPRDQSFRQLHFLVACYYGFRLQPKWGNRAHTKSVERALLKSCTDHLEKAFYHGYACSFAGMNLNYTKVLSDDSDFIEQEYVRHFLSHLSEDDQRTVLRDHRTVETIKRIRQIAEEQDFLNKTFQDKGPLDRDDLRDYARRYWKDLVPPNQTPPQTLPIPFDNQPPGLGG